MISPSGKPALCGHQSHTHIYKAPKEHVLWPLFYSPSAVLLFFLICFVFVIKHVFFLTLKAPITAATDNVYKLFHCFSEKIRLDISCESSARQSHMKHQG